MLSCWKRKVLLFFRGSTCEQNVTCYSCTPLHSPVHCGSPVYCGALHTGTENRFTGSEFNVVTRELHTARRLRALHCSRTITQHSTRCRIRIQIETMWRQSGLWILIPDPHRMRIQGSVWRAPVSWQYESVDKLCLRGCLVCRPRSIWVLCTQVGNAIHRQVPGYLDHGCSQDSPLIWTFVLAS